MYLMFSILQGGVMHCLWQMEAIRPMSQQDIQASQLEQAQLMRGMSQEELAQRYGVGLRNSYQPDPPNGVD